MKELRFKVGRSRGSPAFRGTRPYSHPLVDRIWGMWGSYYNRPEAVFYLLKGDYNPKLLGVLGLPVSNSTHSFLKLPVSGATV